VGKNLSHKWGIFIDGNKTDETIQPDNAYQMSGNKISVRTLDLNCEFPVIATQLNLIVEEHFGI
jgi:5-methylcytosine-specific restriction enzyme subunit McrC